MMKGLRPLRIGPLQSLLRVLLLWMPKRKRIPVPSVTAAQHPFPGQDSLPVSITQGKDRTEEDAVETMSDNKTNDQLLKAVQDLQKAQADIAAQLKETNSKLDKLTTAVDQVQKSSDGSSGSGYQTDGALWSDGPYSYEGKQSLAIVDTAYNKAKELKDRGDDRSFAMIFGQLSMDLRRGL